jgi:N4-gp56 family major capsid protein
MATKTYAVGDAEVVKLWSKRLAREALKRTVCFPYFKDSGDALGTVNSDTSKGPGDRVTITLRMQLTGDGVGENETQEGNEEALVTYTDNVLINELSHAARSNKTISQQRVPFSLAREMNDGLADWWAGRMDTVFFNHLCGYTPANTQAGLALKYAGFNSILAPSSGRQLWTEAGTSADENLDSTGDEMTLTMIDKAVELAQTGGSTGLVPIRPIAGLPGGADYICFVHPTQTTQLRTSTTTNGWMDLQKSLLQGGKDGDSMIWKGGLGVYNKTLLVESNRVTQGVDSGTGLAISTVRRAVFCGAQALGLAFGQGYGPEEWKVHEETFDYQRQLGVNALNIFGMKKMRFNSADFATIVISSYAANAA